MDAAASTSVSLDPGREELPDARTGIANALGALWRWRWRFAAVFAAIIGLGLLVLLALPQRYTAHATIIIGTRAPAFTPSDLPPQGPRREPDVDGEIELITSYPSLKRVIDQLGLTRRESFRIVQAPVRPGLLQRLHDRLAEWTSSSETRPEPGSVADRRLPTPDELAAVLLRRSLTMDRIGRSTLVDIAYNDRNPVLAAEIANALARNASRSDEFISSLSLSEQSGFDVMTASVVAQAGVPWSPSSPQAILVLAPALVLALGAAITAVSVSEYRMRRLVLDSEDVIRRGLQPLALLPPPRKGGQNAPDAMRRMDPFGDAIAGMEAPLSLLRRDKRSALVLLFTSAVEGEGTSTIVSELGRAMAASGQHVLLIDADFMSESLKRRFDLKPLMGLSHLALRDCDATKLIQRTNVANLDNVGVGDPVGRPLEILRSPRFRDAIDEWRRSYDFILIDTPPVLASSEARLLGSITDYAVFVVQWRRTRWDTVMHALRLLSDSGATVAGLALSKVDFAELGRYGSAEGRTYRDSDQRTRRAQR